MNLNGNVCFTCSHNKIKSSPRVYEVCKRRITSKLGSILLNLLSIETSKAIYNEWRQGWLHNKVQPLTRCSFNDSVFFCSLWLWGCSQIMSATEGDRELWKMLTFADKGDRGVRQMLTLADKGGTQCFSLCLWMAGYQLSSHLLSLAAGRQVVESNVFGALLQTA